MDKCVLCGHTRARNEQTLVECPYCGERFNCVRQDSSEHRTKNVSTDTLSETCHFCGTRLIREVCRIVWISGEDEEIKTEETLRLICSQCGGQRQIC